MKEIQRGKMTREILHERVDVFAENMKGRLFENIAKGEWRGMSQSSLLSKLMEEVGSLGKIFANHGGQTLQDECYNIKKECADIANMALMIGENYGEHPNVENKYK